ncbi:uncharacterized protein LOC126816053 [Patella vulgata]|uniref:uncharacterized protein LOC126816053 n=1 Tax=Patella vulgata TaxID=6465 RepID=UPI0021808A7D|nr:uncharacterized protein LOC126816053 [Patella vulgata]
MAFWVKHTALFVAILFVLQSYVRSEISRSIDQRKASYSKSSVVNNTDDTSRVLETVYTSRKMDCSRACTEKADCERYLYCSHDSSCKLYQDGGDCVRSGDTTGCSCYTQTIRCEDSDCTCPSGQYGEGCEATISGCITPASPYSDEHVIPEFDQSVRLWRNGTNLTYSCSPSYYPTVDWTCKANGTWQEPVCKALRKCTELNQCNPVYSEGKYVFKYPGTDHDMIVQCFTTSGWTYVPLSPYTTFSYYSTNYSASCHPKQYTCGYRYFTVIPLLITSTNVYPWGDPFFSMTDCDGPSLYRAGKNCDPECEIPEPGIFQIDLRGTGLKHKPFTLVYGQAVFSDNEQLVTASCDDCIKVCRPVAFTVLLLPAYGTDIDYTNTTRPVCLSRS